MCTTCGCSAEQAKISGTGLPTHEHDGLPAHHHQHDALPMHSHTPDTPTTRRLRLEEDILAKNNSYARENRAFLAGRRVFALNLVSSPGSGKTTLLVQTINQLKGICPVTVIEGDQETSNDAERIRATGAPAIQINTGKGCHLDAHMIGHALQALDPPERSVLMIENVGNLVCPAAFDLGEAHKVVIFSVTEGEDKPLKYPDMFRAADLMILNKCDLLPHLDFTVSRAIEAAMQVNPKLEIIQLSARSGIGMEAWLHWLLARKP